MSTGAQRWLALCAYDGREFSGWQSQKNGNGVQDHIEAALLKISGEAIRLHTGTRTDAGVHARAHPCHFDFAWKHSQEALQRALNDQTPTGIQIISVVKKNKSFHARHDSRRKSYSYHFISGKAQPYFRGLVWEIPATNLDLETMRECAGIFLGTHDFSAFATLSSDRKGRGVDPVKTIFKSQIKRSIYGGCAYHIEGSGFLYRMVRTLTAAIVQAGKGRLSVAEVEEILKNKIRVPAIPTAPAHGLYLEKVFWR